MEYIPSNLALNRAHLAFFQDRRARERESRCLLRVKVCHLYISNNLNAQHNVSFCTPLIFNRSNLYGFRITFSTYSYLLNEFLLYLMMSRFMFSFHFDHFTDGRTPWTGDQLDARPLPKHRINTYTYQTSVPCVGFEHKISASELAKTVYASDRSATVTGWCIFNVQNYNSVLSH
jgi:hypothetical protein